MPDSGRVSLALGAGLLGLTLAASAAPPAVDWRDQVIYFLMIDRFDDGDPGNNDQGAGEYDPARSSHYSGGDLKGVARRLDYLRELGATAIWITPPVANQWWNPTRQHTGYHGYWASDFMAVDPHYGTLGEYRALAQAMHARQLLLVQDIVLNHTGDYFDYAAPPPSDDPALGYRPYPQADAQAPTQWPFSFNDPRRAQDRKIAAYHWTPAIQDYQDPVQLADWQMAGLDDLNTGNPIVRRALRQSYNYWIDQVGVDAFRVDTIFYVPPEDVDDFLYADDRRHPGVERHAAAQGKPDFLLFGEGFATDAPYAETQAQRIERYMTAPDGRRRMDSMINFPLYGSLNDVFARGRPTAELAWRIESMMRVHARPHLLPSFIDNHDVDRFLAGGSEAALKQALLLIMTLPGIPTIYYGTEQGLREPRAAMFAAGYGSGGRDHFDTATPMFRTLQAMIALRKAHPALSRGTPTILAQNAASAGALAYRMDDGESSLLVVFNSSDAPSLLDNVELGLPPGAVLKALYGIDGKPEDLTVGADGRVHRALPARAGLVWQLPASSAAQLRLDALGSEVQHGDFDLRGYARGVQSLRIVVDGDLGSAQTVRPAADGRFSARVDTRAMIDPNRVHRVLAWSDTPSVASAALPFRVRRDWQLAAEWKDPLDDDRGPSGRYEYPDDPGWRVERPGDIEQLSVRTSGGALALELQMRSLVSSWNPPNGFDHVAFTVFIELPGRGDGSREMPQQQAQLPGDLRWHYRLRVNGWTNALHASIGADAVREGSVVTPAASIEVDRATRTLRFVLPPAALGNPDTLVGARIYLSTWDYDGGFRTLDQQAGPHSYGGGAPGDPLVLDDTPILTLEAARE